ncbi:C40 family peptidase [Tissierella carlieri]|uniref:C40 family peptidase n=1 Tax=Tissierella carlieri TaxID=689904 RepID=A0ABT1S712_9FIRM|nr:NlpC/P60 family protein [Tissierella carlieri]MCQ4922258.1 C40 family peptidase [Tissierella carlieri]
MADPSSLGLIAKAAVTALSDERLRKGIGWTLVAILSPFILIIVIIVSLLSGTTNHNNNALDLSFNDSLISNKIPEEYREHIEDMRSSFIILDNKIEEKNSQMEEGDGLDSIRVKAIFYSLYFGENQPSNIDKAKYVDCFVGYEERTRTLTDDEGNEYEEVYEVAIPITNLTEIYKNIENTMGKTVSYEDMANANEIYYRIKYGSPAPNEGDDFEEWLDWSQGLTAEELEELYNDLPNSDKGVRIVQLAMTRLGDPYSQEKRGQGRYTDCSYLTMWSYRQIGITIPATAAEQARFCVKKKITVAKKDLVPGDLVFWSHKPNGRFMNITHVGIYAGGGKVIDASYSKGKVVYRNLFDSNKQVLYARPHILK